MKTETISKTRLPPSSNDKPETRTTISQKEAIMTEKSRFKDHFKPALKLVEYHIALKLKKGERVHQLIAVILTTDLNESIEYLKTVRFREYDQVEVVTVNGRYYNENEIVNPLN